MSIVILEKDYADRLHPRSGFYGDVEHCIKDIRRRNPKAFPWDRWIPDARFYGLLTEEQRVALGHELLIAAVNAIAKAEGAQS